MILAWFIFVFLLGLAVGSFANVLIWRIPRGESVWFSRSRCPDCRKVLAWFELIPLASFLWQGGTCRSCQRPISRQYPVVEFITGIVFTFVLFRVLDLPSASVLSQISSLTFPISKLSELIYLWSIVVALIVIFVTDLRFYIIPDKIVFPVIGISLLYNLVGKWSLGLGGVGEVGIDNWRALALHPFFSFLFAGLFASLFFFSLVLVSRGRWMGMGDVKFALFMGFILGFPQTFVALFLSFLSGSIVGLVLVLLKKRTMQSQLPFGTFLTASTFAALFYGKGIFDWYWNTLL